MTRETFSTARAVSLIEKLGILLVYPLANRPEPRSLWSERHPRTPMRWTWDSEADGRVAQMWRLREELARGHEVVYAKWFRGRATFFARGVFAAMLAYLARAADGDLRVGLSRQASLLIDLLEDDSPQSTKQLRAAAGMQGRANEPLYTRSLKELWSRLLIVGVGEVDDGAFPSLNMSATRHHLEDLWPGGPNTDAPDEARLDSVLEDAPLFARELRRTTAALDALRASKSLRPFE